MSDRLSLDNRPPDRTNTCSECGGPTPNRIQHTCGRCWVERCRRQLEEGS